MGALASTVLTYGDLSKREDVVLNAVEILTAEENQVQVSLGRGRCINMVHSYLTDTLRTAASAAVEQGTDFTAGARTTPSRLTNIVQEIAIPFRVSRPEEVAQNYTGINEVERQTTKALKDWGNALEYDLVRGTLASGISGTAATMQGLEVNISKSTNTTAQTSGTVFSATILDAFMGNNWTNSNGDVVTDLYVGGILRRVVDTFVQKTNQVVNNPAGPQVIVRTISTFETSMGTIQVHKHRFVQQAGDATGIVLGIRPEKHVVAYLDMPFIKQLAESGAYSFKAVYGSLTVETHNQDSNFFANGYLLSV